MHEPLRYPELDVDCTSLELQVIDERPLPRDVSVKQLQWPADFRSTAQARLATLVAGRGAAVQVVVSVVNADEIEVVDARGEMTRIVVKLAQEVKVSGGPVLSRTETQSSSDIPRQEATPEEIEFVLQATARNAFDRRWADPANIQALNGELSAYAKKRESTAAP